MALYFPEGSSQQFSQTFAAAKTITAITNANPAVATITAHGYGAAGTIIEALLTTPWEDATDTVYRLEVVDANSVKILGPDTSDINFFPAGSNTGTAQTVSSWVVIPQVLTIGSSGGDARFTDVQLLARRNAIKVPTGFNSTTVSLSLAHDPALPAYATMLNVSRALRKVAFKQVISGGAVTYGYGYLVVSEFPKLNSNQVNAVDGAMALLGRAISY